MVTVGAFGGICAAAMADIIMMEARRPEPAALARELKSRELAWVFISIALIIVLIVIVLVSCGGRRCRCRYGAKTDAFVFKPAFEAWLVAGCVFSAFLIESSISALPRRPRILSTILPSRPITKVSGNAGTPPYSSPTASLPIRMG